MDGETASKIGKKQEYAYLLELEQVDAEHLDRTEHLKLNFSIVKKYSKLSISK